MGRSKGEYKTFDCGTCGKTCERRATHCKTKRLYCSRECFNTSQPGKVPSRDKENWKTLTCSYCAEEFKRHINHISIGTDKNYCNKACHKLGSVTEMLTLTCEYCKEPFEVVKSQSYRSHDGKRVYRRFCSPKCNHDKGFVDLTCKTCGEDFKRRKTQYRYQKEVQGCVETYCSSKCSGKNNKGRPTGKMPSKWESIECDQCGSDFDVYKNRHKSKKNYCSKECKHTAKHRTVTCESCGKDFEVFKNTYKRKKDYCSAKCKDKLRKNMVSELQPNGTWEEKKWND